MKANETVVVKILTQLDDGKVPTDYAIKAFLYYDNGVSQKILAAFYDQTFTPVPPPEGADWEWASLIPDDTSETVDGINYQGSVTLTILPEYTVNLKQFRRPRLFIELVFTDGTEVIKNKIDMELESYVPSISENL